ncbi:MAG: hypothetical protein AAF709_09780 [Pseudomonadota bacterium]
MDAAVVAAAKELSLSDARTENISEVVKSVLKSNFEAQSADSPSMQKIAAATKITSNYDSAELLLSVRADQPFNSPFGTKIGLKPETLTAQATAQIVGRPNICILALNPSSNGTIDLQHNALITGNNCAVFSNSTHNNGIKAKNSVRLTASTICSAGGFQGKGNQFSPRPMGDCPQFEDPLASRAAPAIGKCDTTLPTEVFESRTLQPGTYCKDLTISNGAIVELAEGIYVFQGARLTVDGNAELRGENVGLYFDAGSQFNFEPRSEIALEAPVSGPMSGLVIFTARNMKKGKSNSILSENAQNLVGTIYLPTAELRIDGAAQIGGDAAYTALVVHDLRIYGGPHVVLNTDYHKTDVPVPAGIRGAGQPVRLIQ